MHRRDSRDWVERFITDSDCRDGERFPRNPFMILALFGIVLAAFLVEVVLTVWED